MAKGRKTRAKTAIDEKNLTKGELRKLNALRKSLGEEIAEKAFAEWYEKRAAEDGGAPDKNAELIAEALVRLIQEQNLRIPRGGYLVKRGRGRVIVTRAEG